MTQPKPEDIARQIVEACAFSRSVKPITWTDDLYENVLLAIREAEARGERRGLKRASEEAMNHYASCGYECCGGHGTFISSAIDKLIPAEPGSTA